VREGDENFASDHAKYCHPSPQNRWTGGLACHHYEQLGKVISRVLRRKMPPPLSEKKTLLRIEEADIFRTSLIFR